jgi:thiamine pyrophosphate-dependent acetolactate synthase large subunit-like protein
VLADVRAALEALATSAPAVKHDDWLSHTQKFVDDWRKEVEKSRTSDQVPIRPERICKELTEVLPKDAILIADTGYAALWTERSCICVTRLSNISARRVRSAGRSLLPSARNAQRRTNR